MKHLTIKTLMLAGTLFMTTSVSAYDFTVDGMYFNILSQDDLTCQITSGDEKYTGTVIIPVQVEHNGQTYTVTGISGYAFNECYGLTDVAISNSVTTISSYAFYYCTKLKNVAIGRSVTTIGQEAFGHCTSLTSVSIPNSVTTIGDMAFDECYGLENITLGENVKTISSKAFGGCRSLKSITLPHSVQTINMNAFEGCTSLTEVTIPSSVTQMGSEVFAGCTSLAQITFEDGSEPLGIDMCYEEKGILHNCPVKTFYLGRNINCTGYYMFNPFEDLTTVTDMTIGSTVTDVTAIHFELFDGLQTICLHAQTPPAVGGFTNEQYFNVSIYVPKGTLEAYQTADTWKNFWNILEGEPTGVTNVETANEQEVKAVNGNIVIENAKGKIFIYDMAGSLVKSAEAYGERIEIAVPQRGVYIVRTSGASAKVAL